MAAHSSHCSTLDGLIRVAEKDDLLLYVTAAVGVFMPGCVYLFYQYAHKLYTEYTQKCESQKREEEQEITAVTVFYAEGKEHTEELARHISSYFDHQWPAVVNLADIDISAFAKYKGIGLFLMDSTVDGREPYSVEWFLEFLDDLAFDKKSVNLPCRQMHYAVLGIGNPHSDHEKYNRAAKVLARRLNAVGAVALCPLCYIYSHSSSKMEKQANIWASRVAEAVSMYMLKIKKRTRSFWFYDDSDSNITSSTDDDANGYSPDDIEQIYDTDDEESEACFEEEHLGESLSVAVNEYLELKSKAEQM